MTREDKIKLGFRAILENLLDEYKNDPTKAYSFALKTEDGVVIRGLLETVPDVKDV